MKSIKKAESLWEMLLDWKSLPLLFIVFTVSLNLIATALYELITALVAPTDWLIAGHTLPAKAVIALGVVVLSVFALVLGVRIFRGLRTRLRLWLDKLAGNNSQVVIGVENDEAFRINRQGLIFSMGEQPDTAQYVLYSDPVKKDAFRGNLKALACLGIICSAETLPTGQIVADEFADAFVKTHPEAMKENVLLKRTKLLPADVTNVKDIHQHTLDLIHWMTNEFHVPVQQMVVDLTGGKKTMSLGVATAADQMRVDQQYIDSRYVNRVVMHGSQKAILVKQFVEPKSDAPTDRTGTY